VKFFLDGCVSRLHVEALRIYAKSESHEFCHLHERFKPETPDPVWIAELAVEGEWIILSADARISTHPANVRAWHESGLTAFFFGSPWPKERLMNQAASLWQWFPKIVEYAKRTPAGHGYHLAKSSKEPRQIYPERKR
jgi:hypothetical protein